MARLECEYRLGSPCTAVAYPYGDVDEHVVLAARRAGYRAGAALTVRTRRVRPLEWPRVGVYRGDDLMRFRMKVSRSGRLVARTRAGPAARAAYARVPSTSTHAAGVGA